ncbi:MAG TPA: hypothetical protein VJR03_10570 [Nitrospira sp.]|nr:hypothetical protein [Nitrospira sp.]
MKILNVAIAVVGIALLFGACSRATISKNWGVTYYEMRANQVLDPTAGEQLNPVEGQDGKVNATASEAYRRSFEKPEADLDRSLVSSGVRTK